MKTRFAAALFALALPLCAQAPISQAPVAAETEGLFYKAFYLEKGPRDFAQAMTLYEQFLAKAPEHKLAGEAARYQFGLLDRLGKTKERDAFKEKYAKLLGDVATQPAGQRGERPAGEAADGERPARPGQPGGAGGQGQRGQRGMGIMGSKPLAEMNDEELEQFKGGLERMAPMMDRMRQNLSEDQQKKLDENMANLKKSLEAGKLEDAQKALDGLREAMPRGRGRGGAGGDAGGAGQGGRGGGGGEGGGRAGGGGGGGGR